MTGSPQFSYEPTIHRGKAVILIRFSNDKLLDERVRKLIGVRWNSLKKAWHVPDNSTYRQKFGLDLMLVCKDVLARINPINQAALEKLIETLQLKTYSGSTLRTYRNEFAQLLYVLKKVSVDTLDANRLRSYFLSWLQRISTTLTMTNVYEN